MSNEIIQLDKFANGVLNGNRCVTISNQAASGLNERYNFKHSNDEAMSMVHSDMLTAGAGIIGGIMLFKRSPAAGVFLLFFGLIALGIVIRDWHVGKKHVVHVSCT